MGSCPNTAPQCYFDECCHESNECGILSGSQRSSNGNIRCFYETNTCNYNQDGILYTESSACCELYNKCYQPISPTPTPIPTPTPTPHLCLNGTTICTIPNICFTDAYCNLTRDTCEYVARDCNDEDACTIDQCFPEFGK